MELVEIEGEEEHKVSKIKDSRINRRTKKIKYLVEWKGYKGEDSWENKANVKNTKTLIKSFHKKNPSAPGHLYITIFDLLKFQPLENFIETENIMSTAHCIILFSIFQYFSDFSLIFLIFNMYFCKSRDL
jgi:hypothetical protein